MPIRINLLAESQSLEDLRRRDPVKRAILVGVCVGVAMLGWSGWLQAKALKQKLALNALEARIQGHTNEYQLVMENRKKLDDVNQKLTALHRLTSARLLNANILNALQHTIIDNVQLVRLKTLHEYSTTDEVKAKTNSVGHLIPAKPPTITEKITLTLEARDNSTNPGDQVNKYQEAIADCAYFKTFLGKTNAVRLKDYGTPTPGGQSLPFSLECRFPDKTR
jgi:Tfp pilus assembly protein PilN